MNAFNSNAALKAWEFWIQFTYMIPEYSKDTRDFKRLFIQTMSGSSQCAGSLAFDWYTLNSTSKKKGQLKDIWWVSSSPSQEALDWKREKKKKKTLLDNKAS